ncbi:MAG TPA: hypothetical protein VFQ61_13885 [Polyangiaceae bacterium]|nr:hypothetical protein [Polyangiaceae bacterium]
MQGESIEMPAQERTTARHRRGATMVEYIIVIGLVALLAIAAFKFFGEKVGNKIKSQGNAVEKINDTAP